MANLENVIKLTRSQYEQLLAGTLSGKTYDANAIYLIESEYQDYILETIRWIYPIGSIYINYTGVKPAWMDQIGTWEAITDRFLLMAGSTYNPIDTGGSSSRTGGEATHTLTTAEMPNHNHAQILTNTNNYSVGIGTGVSGNYYRMNSSTSTNTINQELHTGYVGGGGAHNNMPPYEIVFGWRRIA